MSKNKKIIKLMDQWKNEPSSKSSDQIWDEFEKSLKEGITIDSSHNVCVCCQKPFSDDNVYSEAGWEETKITQMCEKCFDEVTLSEDDVHE